MDLKLCLTVRGIVLGLSGGAFLQRATIFFHRLTANLFFFFVGDRFFVLALKLDDHQHEAHDLINKEQNKRDDHDAQEAGAALQEAEEAAEAVPLGVAFFPSANDVLDVEGVSIRRSVVVTLGACKKSRFCHCISESYTTVTPDSVRHTVADTVVVNVDRSFKCNHLLELGIQELKNGEYVTSTRKVDCVELDVDNVTTIPQEHPTD